MEKKKVILTLCKTFPVTHSMAGKPTGFEDKLKKGEKIHTIRYNAKNVWDERYKGISSGEKFLSVREWTGRPYNSEQREFAQFEKIGLQHVTMTYGSDDAYPQIWIDGKQVPIQEVAKNDGLSVADFVEWFFGNSKENTFEGVVIHFTPFRYSKTDEELIKELGDELCEYRPWKNGEISHGCGSLCEGSYCDQALSSFLDENEKYFDEPENEIQNED